MRRAATPLSNPTPSRAEDKTARTNSAGRAKPEATSREHHPMLREESGVAARERPPQPPLLVQDKPLIWLIFPRLPLHI